MELITTRDLIVSAACILVIYGIGLAVHRLYLSPLSLFPGPRLAALTLWYEFYYDVIKRGRYTWRIAEMHERYGDSSTNLTAPREGIIERLSRSDRSHQPP